MDDPQLLRIQVNGRSRDVQPGCTVTRLVSLLGMEQRRIAVSINRTVVPRSRFDRHAVADGDRVEILEAVGGGQS